MEKDVPVEKAGSSPDDPDPDLSDENTLEDEPKLPENEVATPQTMSGSPNSIFTTLTKYRLLYEDMRARYNELKTNCDEQTLEFEKATIEKDATIEELKSQIERPCVMKLNNENLFVPKPRKNGKGESETNGCEISGCGSTNVDLVKCSMCGNLVCEDCSGVKVAKLRPIMNACNKLYFTCPNCDALIRDTSDVNIYDTLRGKIDVLTDEVGSYDRENIRLKADRVKFQSETKQLQDVIVDLKKEITGQDLKIKMQGGVIQQLQSKEASAIGSETQNIDVNIDAKLEAFSAGILSKVTEIMDTKLGEITATTLAPTIPENPASGSPPTWSNVVSRPQDMKAVMREARNDEKIEEREKQRRANNIIIHGADEIGDTPDEIKKADDGYIKEIFAKIGVEVMPSNISRLGAAKENGKRPIKLAMKSGDDKDKVMRNLGHLKNTERYFGKISFKDDYTSNEREQIRTLTNEAKQKCEENPEKIFKVRGDAKNGWRIVSFPKK